MGSLKTFLFASVLAVTSSPSLAQARMIDPMIDRADPVVMFAICAGRLSALMEHQWMFDGPASEQTALQRAHMIDMLDAVRAPNSGREVLAMRIEAKMAQAALLTRATFNADPRDKTRAARLALQRVRECTGVLLS
ncbi:hypothetical protein PGB28_09335 [Primorskyibacter aestuariivivens]|uniref:hypothetical protein n=1 Tax=Primorskyibacter aestuariivivens TaxID=1888912 RepID=UPI002300F171|nr:hypothetical protein [Primorskyibacter aestuariivivens]MDA7428661.1 hypothetical protein [Primorskyibacter aestuariivivens]